jgi:hypothetical protein
VSGPNGPVRGAGPAYQGEYDIDNSDDDYQVNFYNPSAVSEFESRIKYSPCPREVDLQGLGILVPVQ